MKSNLDRDRDDLKMMYAGCILIFIALIISLSNMSYINGNWALLAVEELELVGDRLDRQGFIINLSTFLIVISVAIWGSGCISTLMRRNKNG